MKNILKKSWKWIVGAVVGLFTYLKVFKSGKDKAAAEQAIATIETTAAGKKVADAEREKQLNQSSDEKSKKYGTSIGGLICLSLLLSGCISQPTNIVVRDFCLNYTPIVLEKGIIFYNQESMDKYHRIADAVSINESVYDELCK